MNIGEAAKSSGVSAKMIRYYESIGLISKAIRTEAGYRVYRDSEVHTLQFIRRSRDLGFSVKTIAQLLALWQDQDRASADVKALALAHVDALYAKIVELEAMAETLKHLAKHCHGDDRPDCPILDDLARTAKPASTARAAVKRRPLATPPGNGTRTAPNCRSKCDSSDRRRWTFSDGDAPSNPLDLVTMGSRSLRVNRHRGWRD